MRIANGVVCPISFERVGTVACVISIHVNLYILVCQDRRRVESMGRLVTNEHSRYVIVQVVRRRNPGRQLSIRNLANCAMDVERRLQFRLRVPTVSEDYQLARRLQVFQIYPPSIRIRLREDGYFPLRIACVSQGVLSARGAVRIQEGVELSQRS